MLEFSKNILEKVSFDRQLFYKELVKAARWVKPDEKLLLKAWCLATFGHVYGDLIRDVFNNISRS
ncbi:MAG: hypothetical protein MUC87_01135 [Bacteroidia bacterium]|jgi:hypothetical protein|nr:hypothetical protein [Bacteroidia bacterium]